jgi:2,4-didehydro-3-deoxy-L-rhamnonate hydrolase
MSEQKFGIGTFSDGGEDSFAGLVIHDRVTDLSDSPLGGASVRELLADWEIQLPALQELADAIGAGAGPDWAAAATVDMVDLVVLPPVHPPAQIFATGANYRTHVVQLVATEVEDAIGGEGESREDAAAALMDERARDGAPYIFLGLPQSVTGAYDDVVLPDFGERHDWELELAVVIGRRAHKVSREEALSYVAGYTICNDITTRDTIRRTDIPGISVDWLWGKCAPTFFPTGPYLVPATHVADPQRLHIELSLNGVTMQSDSTEDMIFGIARQIEHCSHIAVMEPGDMLITGSPSGNGSHWNRFLQPGDVIESSITGLGEQRNHVRGGSPA